MALDDTQRLFARWMHNTHHRTPQWLADRMRQPVGLIRAVLGLPPEPEPPPSPAELAEEIAGKAARLAEALAPPVPAAEPVVPAPVDPTPTPTEPLPLAALEPGSLRPGRHVVNNTIVIVANPAHGLRVR